MIIYVEDRQLVVESYINRFEKAGEMMMRLTASDLRGWIRTGGNGELASVEAFLIGECETPNEVVSLIRNEAHVPVLALLDTRCLERLIGFYRLGVDDVVAKPVHFEELLVRIAAIKKRIVNPILKSAVKAITVYFDGRDPEYHGKSLQLPRRERRILEYLASINGRRATKVQIFGAIYGVFDEVTEENVIESHISKLRKKLREHIGFDPIDSKRYLGYQLDPKFVCVENRIQKSLVA